MGFIPVDERFRVRDADDVFAVGDATAGAYKQGGLAAQHADVVAEEIAWRIGSERAPRPYRPVLRGLLRTVDGPRYLRAEPPGAALSAEVSRTACGGPRARSRRAGSSPGSRRASWRAARFRALGACRPAA